MPPLDYGSFATKDDARSLGIELRGEMSELRGQIAELRGEMSGLRGEIAELRGEMSGLRGEIAEVRGELKADIAAVSERSVGHLRLMIGTQVASTFVLLNFLG